MMKLKSPKSSPTLLSVAQAATSCTTTAAKSMAFLFLPEIDSLISTVASTNELLLTLRATLRTYRHAVFCDDAFIPFFCAGMLRNFEDVRKVIDGKMRGDEGAIKEVVELRKRLESQRDRVWVLVDGLRIVALRAIGNRDRTVEERGEWKRLKKGLSGIVKGIRPMQEEYAAHLEERENSAQDGVPGSSDDVKDSEKTYEKGSVDRVISSSSSMTVVDNSIEEAWLLSVNEPKKTLNLSHKLFGVTVLKSYIHEPASYSVQPLQASAAEIKDILESARGPSNQIERQANLEKMILKLDDKAQAEIQKLLENKETASDNVEGRREWEVVAMQMRLKIAEMKVRRRWWKKREM